MVDLKGARNSYLNPVQSYYSFRVIMSELESMSSISESEDTPICPLCYNELDATDQSLLPCPCNFQVL